MRGWCLGRCRELATRGKGLFLVHRSMALPKPFLESQLLLMK